LRCLPYVSRPGAEAFTRASFAVHDREPGLDLTYDNPPADAPRKRSAERIGEANHQTRDTAPV